MNTKDNRRKRASRQKIEQAAMELLRTKELDQISVSELCKRAGLNRSTFYANYVDIYGLADALRENLEAQVAELYHEEITQGYNSHNYLALFRHIRQNQILYRTYFKLGYDEQHQVPAYDRDLAKRQLNDRFIEYHIEFFRAGLTRIIKLWLRNGCRQTPEEMFEILKSEYQGREALFAAADAPQADGADDQAVGQTADPMADQTTDAK